MCGGEGVKSGTCLHHLKTHWTEIRLENNHVFGCHLFNKESCPQHLITELLLSSICSLEACPSVVTSLCQCSKSAASKLCQEKLSSILFSSNKSFYKNINHLVILILTFIPGLTPPWLMKTEIPCKIIRV